MCVHACDPGSFVLRLIAMSTAAPPLALPSNPIPPFYWVPRKMWLTFATRRARVPVSPCVCVLRLSCRPLFPRVISWSEAEGQVQRGILLSCSLNCQLPLSRSLPGLLLREECSPGMIHQRRRLFWLRVLSAVAAITSAGVIGCSVTFDAGRSPRKREERGRKFRCGT